MQAEAEQDKLTQSELELDATKRELSQKRIDLEKQEALKDAVIRQVQDVSKSIGNYKLYLLIQTS